MDKYIEARFGEYKNKSLEELLSEQESLSKEIDGILKDLDDKTISSYEKTELRNDLSYAKDKLYYIEYLIDQFSQGPDTNAKTK